MNSARTGFDSLRAIHRRDPEVLKEMEIYIDGGARRGTDVLMALALGAKGVGLGRPFLYAQAAYGEKGAIRAVRSEFHSRWSCPSRASQFEILSFWQQDSPIVIQQELVTAMQLMGVRKLDELRPEMVECLSELWR
jgi:L-lactate dehydrogenase (cytochrome)